ncbi:hypothetical protein C823_001292 [Eubacterium plexicaudatum ASF492]|uniref:Uncharacterized protein n=1 Tax=Eubacterium plexicaudatum ASF492 TaxID=1235802 RepID=N2B5Y0_9FIRM|nr:hypothetical protein C823_001292 [Eubacterium plexicaudatum ASF492]
MISDHFYTSDKITDHMDAVKSRTGEIMYLIKGSVGGTFTKYAVMDENSNFYGKDKVPTATGSLEEFVDMLVAIYENYRDTVCG